MVCQPLSRDCVYDLVVERNGVFEMVQVKTISGHTIATSNRSADANEPVSLNGKQRNRYYYRDHGVHWLVGVTKSEPYEVYYYPLDVYQHHEKIDIRHVPPGDIGYNVAIQSNGKRGVSDDVATSPTLDL